MGECELKGRKNRKLMREAKFTERCLWKNFTEK